MGVLGAYDRFLISAALVIAAALTLGGCASTLGARTILPAQQNYNLAVAQAANEQILLNLVRLRYRDTTTFFDVGSVVTQYRFNGKASASPGLDLGTISESSLGLSLGTEYQEQPTITYTPLTGPQFAQRLLAPIAPEVIVLLSDSGWNIERLLLCCVDRINNVRNIPGASGPTPEAFADAPAFRTVASDLRKLQVAQLIDVYVDPSYADEPVALVRIDSQHAAEAGLSNQLEQFRTDLKLRGSSDTFRIVGAPPRGGTESIYLRGRSLLGVLYALSHAVEIPKEHVANGLVTVSRDASGAPADWRAATGDIFSIASSTERPKGAFVDVRYRGHWFYISDDDLTAKTTFSLLNYLIALQSTEKGAQPLLTLSAGG